MPSDQVLTATHSQQKYSVEFVVTTLVIAAIAFLATPMGPLGVFWRPPADSPQPTNIQMSFFLLLNAVESLVLGLGISFLVFGYSLIKRISNASIALTRAAFFSIVWLLASWFPHDSLHHHNGQNVSGLLLIEYGFHFTLMVAGVIVAYFFWTIIRDKEDNVC